MRKIKIVGFFVLLTFAILIMLFNVVSSKEKEFSNKLNLIGTQKSHTQEISKTVFYTNRYKKELPKSIDNNMYDYLANQKSINDENRLISDLSYDFFDLVNQFKYVYNGNVPHNIVILDKLVNNIYKKNMQLVVAYEKYAQLKKYEYQGNLQAYRIALYTMFVVLLLLLIYMFTRIDEVIMFVQKFTKTSENIIEKSTIQELEPISINSHNIDLDKATDNFNMLVGFIDNSLRGATDSIGHSIGSLENVEQNIELLISLIHQMQDVEKETIYKKEDTVIESLETLMALNTNLKSLKEKVEKLI